MFLGSTPHLLHQTLWSWGPGICLSDKTLINADAPKTWKTPEFEEGPDPLDIQWPEPEIMQLDNPNLAPLWACFHSLPTSLTHAQAHTFILSLLTLWRYVNRPVQNPDTPCGLGLSADGQQLWEKLSGFRRKPWAAGDRLKTRSAPSHDSSLPAWEHQLNGVFHSYII